MTIKRSSDRFRYFELRPEEFRARIEQCAVAYVPLGTLEWHGEHLPAVPRSPRGHHPTITCPMSRSQGFRNDEIEGVAQRFIGLVAEHACRTCIPEADDPISVRHDDSFLGVIDDLLTQRLVGVWSHLEAPLM